MTVPNRSYSSPSYRYGFNGKEKDDEVKGSGMQYDYGFRIYDPRLGKFLSQDPLFKSFPWYTPYQYAGNKPIKFIDLDGLEEANVDIIAKFKNGDVLLKVSVNNKVLSNSNNGMITFHYKDKLDTDIYIDDNLPEVIGSRVSEYGGGSRGVLNAKSPEGTYNYAFQLDTKGIADSGVEIFDVDSIIVQSETVSKLETVSLREGINIEGGFTATEILIRTPVTFKFNTTTSGGGGYWESADNFINGFAKKVIADAKTGLSKLNQNKSDVENVKVSVNDWLFKSSKDVKLITEFIQAEFPNAKVEFTNDPKNHGSGPGLTIEAKEVKASELYDVPTVKEKEN